jgi:prevent-host-death family protein
VTGVDEVGTRRLRSDLAALLRRAERGERIVVTSGGRPVAQLGPVEPEAGVLTLADLAAAGLVEPASRGDRPDPAMTMPTWAGTRLDQLVREIRGR